MLATTARPAGPARPDSYTAANLSATETTAARIFAALRPLHRLRIDDLELLNRAAAGLRFIRSTGTYSELEHRLFGVALAELDAVDAFVVESAACSSADFVALGDLDGGYRERHDACRRSLWLAAILRLADGFCAYGGPAAHGVYAAWTESVVYVEFDEVVPSGRQSVYARTRVAALEAVAQRKVCVASSRARREAV